VDVPGNHLLTIACSNLDGKGQNHKHMVDDKDIDIQNCTDRASKCLPSHLCWEHSITAGAHVAADEGQCMLCTATTGHAEHKENQNSAGQRILRCPAGATG